MIKKGGEGRGEKIKVIEKKKRTSAGVKRACCRTGKSKNGIVSKSVKHGQDNMSTEKAEEQSCQSHQFGK
jgi:hypothetical protein